MSRQTDALAPAAAAQLAAIEPVTALLPAINWGSIGHSAPQPLATARRAVTDPLPRADVLIITWTNAEWSALDHVFANSGSSRGSQSAPGSWSTAWLPYARDVGSYTSGENSAPLWGFFREVAVTGSSGSLRVILFHSDAHLQYQPYIDGLRAMVTTILKDTQPSELYSQERQPCRRRSAMPSSRTRPSCWPAFRRTTPIRLTARLSPVRPGIRRRRCLGPHRR